MIQLLLSDSRLIPDLFYISGPVDEGLLDLVKLLLYILLDISKLGQFTFLNLLSLFGFLLFLLNFGSG